MLAAVLVFAYYLMAFPTYSDTLDGYKQDIRDAQSVGIDGFALNVGAWSAEPYYQSRVANMFEAARQVNSNFKLFLSPDMAGSLTDADIRSMVSTYAGHGSYWKYKNRPVLTAWMAQGKGEVYWKNLLRAGPLKRYNLLFLPYMYVDPGNGSWTSSAVANWNNPTYSQIKTQYDAWWKNVVDGLMFYAAPGTAEEDAATNEAYAQVMREAGKPFMAGVKPYFWEGRLSAAQPDMLRKYYETHGGEGIARQWDSVRTRSQPQWVILDTWNDFTEAYVSPADPESMTLKRWFYNVGPLLKKHDGISELMRYYIAWFKSGASPTMTSDEAVAFYRVHGKDLNAAYDVQNVYQYGGTLDTIFVTTLLKANATLRVTSGGVVTDIPVTAGIVHSRIPFAAGPQSFAIIRNGVTVAQKDGGEIVSSISYYDFIPYALLIQ